MLRIIVLLLALNASGTTFAADVGQRDATTHIDHYHGLINALARCVLLEPAMKEVVAVSGDPGFNRVLLAALGEYDKAIFDEAFASLVRSSSIQQNVLDEALTYFETNATNQMFWASEAMECLSLQILLKLSRDGLPSQEAK